MCGQANGPLPLQEKLERVILGSKAAQQQPEEVRGLWQTCGELMFSLEPRLRHLGLGKEVRLPAPQEWRASFDASRCGMERRGLMGRQWALPYTHEAKLGVSDMAGLRVGSACEAGDGPLFTVCCLCYNFPPGKRWRGRGRPQRGGTGALAPERESLATRSPTQLSATSSFPPAPFPAGHHHLFFRGLYHRRCQSGPRLSGLTGLGNLGQCFDGAPSPLAPALGLQLGSLRWRLGDD